MSTACVVRPAASVPRSLPYSSTSRRSTRPSSEAKSPAQTQDSCPGCWMHRNSPAVNTPLTPSARAALMVGPSSGTDQNNSNSPSAASAAVNALRRRPTRMA
ncbi:hypothetical protein ACFQ0B_57450 [Nonomuraea thailandensis]